jgi:pimeloyl-ACP methyl ester carboxylesterase
MRRSVLALIGLISSSALYGCLSQPTALETDGGTADTGTVVTKDAGGDVALAATNTNDEDSVPPYITYMDDLATHPGCTTAGLASRKAADGTPAGYTAAVINGGAFKCAAKEYPLMGTDDPSKPIIVLVHGNSSTPNDWEKFTTDTTPMISETLIADGYHVYASDVRYDMVPTDTKNNPSKNYDHGWAVPIVESLLTNLFAQYPAPRMFNLAGFSIGPTVIKDALRRMLRKGQNPFARIHALHLASGGFHGVSTFAAECGTWSSPINPTMAGLAACQLGNRTGYTLTPFETPLDGTATPDAVSFDTPCSDGNTAYGQAGVCGGNAVVYTTVVFQDPPSGPLLDEFVSEESAHLDGANNMTVTEQEPSVCMGTGASATCTGFFFDALFKYHYGAIRSAQGVAIAKAALETQ